MILILDDDAVMGRCLMRILQKNGKESKLFNNGIDAMAAIENEAPEMIFMDVGLTGPDGFTFLNEMASYADTMNVPVVIVSEKDFAKWDLKAYNVVGFLDKNTMKPENVEEYIRALKPANKLGNGEEYVRMLKPANKLENVEEYVRAQAK